MHRFLWRKLVSEADRAWALAQYPLRKGALLSTLAASMSRVNIETTNICNADCVFCAYQHQERPKGVMSDELFGKVIDEFVACGGGKLGLTPTVGDPLVDPGLIDRIAYARRQPGITTIEMYSNMISLQRFGAAALVNSGLSSLIVSTSGPDEAMYQRVYRSKMYRTMLANVLAFAAANNAAGRPVKLFVDMRVDRPLRRVCAMADYKTVADAVGPQNIGVKFRYDAWGGKIKQSDLSGNMKLRRFHHLHLTPCSEMYAGPQVYWDGKVGACSCRDVNASELVIGDVSRHHLGEIWFGAELQRLRDEFLTDKRNPLCKECSHYNNVSIYLTRRGKHRLAQLEPSPYARRGVSQRGKHDDRDVPLPVLPPGA